MLRPMGVHVLGVVVAAVAVASLSSCTTGLTAAEGRVSASTSPSALTVHVGAESICEHALHVPVAASSLLTVGEVRDFEVGGRPPLTPHPGRRSARLVFPAAARSDIAAWCTVASGKTLAFYAASPNSPAVEVENLNGYSGAVPDHPGAIP